MAFASKRIRSMRRSGSQRPSTLVAHGEGGQVFAAHAHLRTRPDGYRRLPVRRPATGRARTLRACRHEFHPFVVAGDDVVIHRAARLFSLMVKACEWQPGADAHAQTATGFPWCRNRGRGRGSCSFPRSFHSSFDGRAQSLSITGSDCQPRRAELLDSSGNSRAGATPGGRFPGWRKRGCPARFDGTVDGAELRQQFAHVLRAPARIPPDVIDVISRSNCGTGRPAHHMHETVQLPRCSS